MDAQMDASAACEVFVIRRVASLDELHAAFVVIGAQFDPPIGPPDWRFDTLVAGFEANRHLMLVAERDGRIVGGVLSLLDGESVGVSIIGFDPSVRGIGLARRMLQITEVEAMARGACRVRLGARKATKGFYERLGFQGQGTYMQKGLPLPGRSVEFRVRRWLAAIGDLDRGELVRVDPATGTLPTVF